MKILKVIIGIFVLFFVPVVTSAQGTGSAALDFLNIGVSAKSSATGGAFSAIADGPVSSFYNPAGLANIENYQIAGMHTEWYQDLRYEYLGYGMPIGNFGGAGLSFSYLSYGSIRGFSESGAESGNIEAFDMALNLSYGHRITDRLFMGLGIKGVTEKLADVSTRGFAGDFGLQYRAYKYMVGLSVMNFGPKLKYESSSSPLPTTVNAGVSYSPFGSDLSLMMGASMPLHGEFSFKTGIEYSYQNIFMLRGGYDSARNFDNKGGISFGAGINISNHNLDYAYNINDLMGGTHQISFVFKLGESRSSNENKSSPIQPEKNISEKEINTESNDDFSALGSQTDGDKNIPLQEIYTASSNAKPDNLEKRYQICAAKYKNKESALKHVDTLKKFGVESKLYYDGLKEYRVVVAESKKLSKAEKIKLEFEKKGVFCFIQEL
jgi:hypothetical protein